MQLILDDYHFSPTHSTYALDRDREEPNKLDLHIETDLICCMPNCGPRSAIVIEFFGLERQRFDHARNMFQCVWAAGHELYGIWEKLESSLLGN